MFLSATVFGMAQSQDTPIDLSEEPKTTFGYQHAWDTVSDRLTFYRDVTSVSEPGLRWIGRDGKAVLVYPLKDFPEGQVMMIWSAASTPDDGAVASAIVSYGPLRVKPPSPIKSLLLTYDSKGTLTKVWDVAPRHHFHLAVDKGGNVFALGLSDSTAADYPLLVEYSPEARVIRQFLPANTFKYGDSAISAPSENGTNQMFIAGESILIWIAQSRELLRLSLNGALESRVSFVTAIDKLQADIYKRAFVRRVGVSSGRLIMQVEFLPKDDNHFQVAMVSASLDGSEAKLLGPFTAQLSPGVFEGTSSTGELTFLEDATTSKAVLRRH